jgi:AraC-like DNA-binding protein
MTFLAKIAAELRQAVAGNRAGGPSSAAPSSRVLATGEGWSVEDLLCTRSRHDRAFEEQHSSVSIAVVLAGTFQYRTPTPKSSSHLMTPGSLLLGNAGQAFECSHEHGAGDRCLSFHFSPEYFENIAADAGARAGERNFRVMRLPAMREFSQVIARALATLARGSGPEPRAVASAWWEEIALKLAAESVCLASGASAQQTPTPPGTLARVTRALRRIEENPTANPSVRRLALDAGLSPYHFLRTFEQLTGVTPHRYVRRARLRHAATQLLTESGNILNVIMDCGFGDVSSFNRAFRHEFGMSPRQFRREGFESEYAQ